jgi:hypothetical protein
MAVKHVPTGEVHSGTKGGYTGCGFDTRVNPSHWVNTPLVSGYKSNRVNCLREAHSSIGSGVAVSS